LARKRNNAVNNRGKKSEKSTAKVRSGGETAEEKKLNIKGVTDRRPREKQIKRLDTERVKNRQNQKYWNSERDSGRGYPSIQSNVRGLGAYAEQKDSSNLHGKKDRLGADKREGRGRCTMKTPLKKISLREGGTGPTNVESGQNETQNQRTELMDTQRTNGLNKSTRRQDQDESRVEV